MAHLPSLSSTAGIPPVYFLSIDFPAFPGSADGDLDPVEPVVVEPVPDAPGVSDRAVSVSRRCLAGELAGESSLGAGVAERLRGLRVEEVWVWDGGGRDLRRREGKGGER